MRYQALDAWRGLAALVVAIARFDIDSALSQSALVRLSYPLVDFFFVLSGFVIAHAYLERLDGSGRAAAGFVMRRFGRLWPLHAFTLLILVGIEAAKLAMIAAGIDSRTVPFTGEQAPSTILSSLLFLQSMGLHAHAVWNTPAWSISVEFWTYLIFLVVVTVARSRIVVLSIVIAALGLAVLATRAPHGMESTFDFGLFRGLAGFFVGVLVYIAHKGWRPAGGRVAWTSIEAAAVAALGLWLIVSHRTPIAYATPMVMAAVVLVFAAERGAVSARISGAIGRSLGAWSYSIYLVCPLIAYVMERSATLAERALGRPIWVERGGERLISLGSEAANAGLLITYVAAVIAVSALTYRFIEAPARQWFNRRAAQVEASRPALSPAE